MAAKPWLTSDDLVNSVKLNILVPISQSTFTTDDILSFANKEMATSQVPSILQFHEEFFVAVKEMTLKSNQSVYPIPYRAVGLKLRDLMYKDTAGNLYEMTRITGDDDIFTAGSGSGTPPYKFKLQGNDVILVPNIGSQPSGSLIFVYYLRPNQLVPNRRAAIISAFTESISITNGSIVAGDTITINVIQRSTDGHINTVQNSGQDDITVLSSIEFTAVSGSPGANEFQIGATATDTASNLSTAINSENTYNSTDSNGVVTIEFEDLMFQVETSNDTAFVIADTTGIQFENLPTTDLDTNTGITTDLFVDGALIDFLQTKPGHKIRSFDVEIPVNGVTTNAIEFESEDVPLDLEVGDYICLANECIIPQIPSDLHEVLAERTSARIQKALGDQAGLQATQGKIQEMEHNQARLIDNRAEGTPQKVLGRHSLLKIMARRRSHLRGW
jgi:hypothetical protein